MKTIRKRGISAFLFLSLLMSATLVSAQGAIVASGKYITKNVKVSGFDRIQLKGSPTIEYTQSSGGTKVQVTGSDNLVDLIECRVEGSTLIVNMKPHTNISYGKAGRLKVLVSSPSLRSAFLQGSGDIYLGNLKAEELEVSLAGSGDMTLSGSTRDATLVLSRSGELNARKLDAENVTARVNGSGDITCVATKTLVTNIQGSGEVSYKGNPSVRSTGKNHLNRL